MSGDVSNLHTTILGTLYTIAAPSGAGKTSLVKALVDSIEHLKVSISYTTRAPRPGEIDGVNYRFVSDAQFQEMIEQQAFLEYAKVFQHYYGTSNHWLERQLQKGNDVILEIDWQGVRQIKQLFPDCRRIFILPPSIEVLTERLVDRAQDDPTVIAARMQVAKEEISHYKEADLLVVNDDFQQTLQDLTTYIMTKTIPPWQDQLKNQLLAKKLLGA
jgi:guanylate kinase